MSAKPAVSVVKGAYVRGMGSVRDYRLVVGTRTDAQTVRLWLADGAILEVPRTGKVDVR